MYQNLCDTFGSYLLHKDHNYKLLFVTFLYFKMNQHEIEISNLNFNLAMLIILMILKWFVTLHFILANRQNVQGRQQKSLYRAISKIVSET